jgi:hypothetical protein
MKMMVQQMVIGAVGSKDCHQVMDGRFSTQNRWRNVGTKDHPFSCPCGHFGLGGVQPIKKFFKEFEVPLAGSKLRTNREQSPPNTPKTMAYDAASGWKNQLITSLVENNGLEVRVLTGSPHSQ